MLERTVPDEELQRLSDVVVKAHTMANDGRVLSGHLLILNGMMFLVECPEKWSPNATRLWAQALEEYKSAYPRNWVD